MKFYTYFLALVILLFVSGCATQQTPEVALQVDDHQLILKKQNNWLLKGKIGFKNDKKKQSANLRWLQKSNGYQLNLTSIIGTSILKMIGNKDSVTLTTDEETYQDTNASRLISDITGWELPIENLQFWVKGQYGINDIVTISEQGWVTQLIPECDRCENWLINYGNYQLVQDIWLPHKITLNNQSNGSQLLIKVNTWALN